ncbi:negative regulator of sigma E activity [Xanthomonas sp. F1]
MSARVAAKRVIRGALQSCAASRMAPCPAQVRTRFERIASTCDMLAVGKRRVCCFDRSGLYSKAFAAPQAQ